MDRRGLPETGTRFLTRHRQAGIALIGRSEAEAPAGMQARRRPPAGHSGREDDASQAIRTFGPGSRLPGVRHFRLILWSVWRRTRGLYFFRPPWSPSGIPPLVLTETR